MSIKEEKKLIRFAWEELELLCEWEDCKIVKSVMDSFTSHLYEAHLSNLTDGDLTCHWKECQGFTLTLPELRRHILFHAFHTKIKCYGKNLQDRKGLPNCILSIQSRNLIPELPDPLICYWQDCKEEFECPEYFYRHVDNHALYDSKRDRNSAECLWHDCNRTFNDQYKAKDHLRSHTQEKLVACPTCGGVFASRTKFFDHIQRQNTALDNVEEDTFVCEYCSRKMSSERLLRDHMRHHVNHYKCPYCDMTCPTPSAMQGHMNYRHSQNKPHACQYCDYRGKSQNDLRKHLETHSMVPTFKCPAEECNYATRSQTCFSSHFKKKHEDKSQAKYSCHLCDKTFTRGNYLTKHLLSKHKFQWPSGHCRFRYHLREDGCFRLQTVRYESLELSQSMMCDNSEDIDSPDIVIEGTMASNENESFCDKNSTQDPNTSASLKLTNQLLSNSSSAKVVYYVQSADGTEYRQVCSEDQQPNETEEQPVLIQILEADSDMPLTTPYGSSVVLLEMSDQEDNVQQSLDNNIIIQTSTEQIVSSLQVSPTYINN